MPPNSRVGRLLRAAAELAEVAGVDRDGRTSAPACRPTAPVVGAPVGRRRGCARILRVGIGLRGRRGRRASRSRSRTAARTPRRSCSTCRSARPARRPGRPATYSKPCGLHAGGDLRSRPSPARPAIAALGEAELVLDRAALRRGAWRVVWSPPPQPASSAATSAATASARSAIASWSSVPSRARAQRVDRLHAGRRGAPDRCRRRGRSRPRAAGAASRKRGSSTGVHVRAAEIADHDQRADARADDPAERPHRACSRAGTAPRCGGARRRARGAARSRRRARAPRRASRWRCRSRRRAATRRRAARTAR